MSYPLSRKLRELAPYQVDTGRMSVRLDANESFLPLPREIRSEMLALIAAAPLHRYPDTLAAECCAAFAGYYGVDPALVTAGNGSDELISLILQGCLSRGDKLLLTEPDFSMYAFNAQVAELETVRYTKTAAYQIEPEALIAQARREGCRGLIFSNPCNPTSQGLDKEALRAILTALPETLVVLDEAYMDFWDQSLLREAGAYDNLIILRTMSKAMGAAGIRLGFAVAGPLLTGALRALKSPYNVSSLTQAAGLAVFRHPGLLREALGEILAGRAFLAGALSRLEGEWRDTPLAFHLTPAPKTNFVVLSFADKAKHQEVYEALRNMGILVRCFPDFLRVSVGSAAENQTFLDALITLAESGGPDIGPTPPCPPKGHL